MSQITFQYLDQLASNSWSYKQSKAHPLQSSYGLHLS